MSKLDYLSLSDIEDALGFIPSDDRDLWVKMGMALYDEYGETAFNAWDSWSQFSPKYDARIAETTWKSISRSSGSGKNATIASVIYEAKQRGWKPAKSAPPDPAVLKAHADERERRRVEAQRVASELAAKAAAKAAEIWAMAKPYPADGTAPHGYLRSKAVGAHGIRHLDSVALDYIDTDTGEIKTYTVKDALVIPAWQDSKTLGSVQIITADGKKRFLLDGAMAGGYSKIGTIKLDTPVIAIAEGYATGATVYEATGIPVVLAFNAGNIAAVAAKMRKALPNVRIIYAADNDHKTTGNPGLTAAKKSSEANPGDIVFPEFLPDADGSDWNDYAKLNGIDAVRTCFMPPKEPPPRDKIKPEVSPPQPENKKRPKEPEYSDDLMIYSSMPMKTAELFMEKLPEGRIMHWRGEFYSWDGMRYVVRDKVFVQQLLYNFTAKCFTLKVNLKTGDSEVVQFSPKRNAIEDIEHAMRAVSYTDIPEPQCWIEKHDGDPPANEIIAFRNGFLHWPTRTLLPSTDRLFVTSALDFEYNPHAASPDRWTKFLHDLWPDDPESISALADMFGYLLTDDTSQQKMFMFIGPPRSGKGTILRVLESLVGYSNRVSPSLASIGTQFGLQPLIGKRLAMISDARLSGRADQQPIVENMLRISGEDALSIDRKNISAWTGKLPTRFVLASNELPAFSDASAALANRFIIFKFTQSFLGREDMSLTGKLLQELPSIVLWALDGLERLQERGHLIRPASADDLSEDMIEQTSPIRSFVSDRCLVGSSYNCDRDELYKEWKEWCVDQGRDHPGTKVHFGKQLGAAFPEIKRSQPRVSGTGKNDDYPVPRARLNLYEGIRIRSMFDS